jgi:hypothetical protein
VRYVADCFQTARAARHCNKQNALEYTKRDQDIIIIIIIIIIDVTTTRNRKLRPALSLKANCKTEIHISNLFGVNSSLKLTQPRQNTSNYFLVSSRLP